MSTSLICGSLRVDDARNQLLAEPGDVHSVPGRVDPVSKKYYRVFSLGLGHDRGAGESSMAHRISQRCHPLLVAGHAVGAFVGRGGYRGEEGTSNAGRELFVRPAADGFKEPHQGVRRAEDPRVAGGSSQIEGGFIVDFPLHHPAPRLIFGGGNYRLLPRSGTETGPPHPQRPQDVDLHHFRQGAACQLFGEVSRPDSPEARVFDGAAWPTVGARVLAKGAGVWSGSPPRPFGRETRRVREQLGDRDSAHRRALELRQDLRQGKVDPAPRRSSSTRRAAATMGLVTEARSNRVSAVTAWAGCLVGSGAVAFPSAASQRRVTPRAPR